MCLTYLLLGETAQIPELTSNIAANGSLPVSSLGISLLLIPSFLLLFFFFIVRMIVYRCTFRLFY